MLVIVENTAEEAGQEEEIKLPGKLVGVQYAVRVLAAGVEVVPEIMEVRVALGGHTPQVVVEPLALVVALRVRGHLVILVREMVAAVRRILGQHMPEVRVVRQAEAEAEVVVPLRPLGPAESVAGARSESGLGRV